MAEVGDLRGAGMDGPFDFAQGRVRPSLHELWSRRQREPWRSPAASLNSRWRLSPHELWSCRLSVRELILLKGEIHGSFVGQKAPSSG